MTTQSPAEKPEPNPEWEALADAAHEAIRAEAGPVEPAETLAMLKRWKADAEPANERGQITFSRALLDCATDALEALLSPAPAQGDVAGLVEEMDKAILGLNPLTGYGEDAVWRPADKARSALIQARDILSALTSTRGVGIEEAAADDDLKGAE